MKMLSRWFAVGLLVALVLPTIVHAQSGNHVDVLTVSGAIDAWVDGYINRGISAAEQDGAEAVVIVLNTPGGSLTAMQSITTRMLNARVPVVVFISPQGAWAGSAGTFITMAANVAAMAPGTAIGAAHPVDSSGQDISGDERDKVTNFSVALIQSIAKQRGRNVTWAGEAVKNSKSATAQEAVELQVIDLIASDMNDLLNKMDGKAVKTVAGEFTLHTQRIGINNIDMNIFELFLHTIVDPTIALILLQMGLLAIVVEIYNPGATIPAIIGAICLVMAFVALGNLPVNWGGVIFIVLSVVLFILDIKVTGFALTVGGVIMFILGAILLFTPLTPVAPTMPTVSVNPIVIIGLGLAMGAFFFFILGAAVRGRNMPVVSGTSIVMNAVGIALSDLAPSGIVRVKSEEWTAQVEEGTIKKGDSVRVVGIEGLRLKVVKQ